MRKVNRAIAQDLDALLSGAQRLLFDIEHNGLRYYPGSDHDGEKKWGAALDKELDALREALRDAILTLAVRVAIYTDALKLGEGRRLLDNWRRNWTDVDLAKTHEWHTSEGDGVESRPLNELRQIVDGLLVLTRPVDAGPPDPVSRNDRKRLEYALRSLAKVCRDRSVSPKREHDVQEVLHSHLEGIFPDYIRSPQIDKPLMSFRPDGGVQSLKAAIECKFVSSEREAKTAIHGLTEDLSGYAGSKLWKYFFTVIYMTEAFNTEGQWITALGASGHSGAWTTILVTGAGAARSGKQIREARTRQRAAHKAVAPDGVAGKSRRGNTPRRRRPHR